MRGKEKRREEGFREEFREETVRVSVFCSWLVRGSKELMV